MNIFNQSFRWYYHLRWLFLILLGLVIYGQTFGYNFVFDDNFYMLDNPYIRGFDRIHQIWAILPQTRLVGVYSFALNYQINLLNPCGYHVFNFIIHLIAVGFVWALSNLLFKITGLIQGKKNKGEYRELGFFIAVLFLVHPCQTQAVSYISQRFESMSTMFYLGSVYFYLRGRTASLKQQMNFFVFSIVFAILGILTKEVAATIPLTILAVEFIIFNKTSSKSSYFQIIFLGAAFVSLFMYLVGSNFINAYFNFSAPSESHQGDIITGGKYVLTQMRVFLTFLRLLIFPINQNLDYDYPLSTGFLEPPLTLVGFCLIGAFIFLILKWRKKWPLMAFGLAWILITFSINTAPRVNVIFEHKLYLISFGFFLAAVYALSITIKDRKILFTVLIAIIFVLSCASFKRNQVWKDEFSLWSDIALKSPHKARAYNGIGVFYGKQQNFVQSIQYFNKAIEINPKYAEAYNNRGNSYLKEGDYAEAIKDLNKAIEIRPNYAESYSNRGSIDEAQGDPTGALSDYNKAISLNVNYIDAYYKRALLSDKGGNFAQAILDYNKIIDINPAFSDAYYFRGLSYTKLGNYNGALSDFTNAIQLNPSFPGVYYNRAATYFYLKEYDKAWQDVDHAEILGINVSPAFLNALKKASNRETKKW